eukprot:comp19477_c0_seq2/m.22686 comp19477_c0_seq2/g.22686  ORF comp19477_c0_seq2/g.22686 comp19477_c0_seq2/m.22686 type:complete len:373 (-) comp19477_c0_seq2:476-1594(-)
MWKCKLPKLCHWGPALALALIFGISAVGVLILVRTWPPTFAMTAHLLVFACEVILLLVSYFLAIFLGPEKHQYCHRCENYKPPRSHHCRICDRCVLKMDHHCPWINGCVGHRNHRPFVLFLWYVCEATGHALYFAGWRMYYVVKARLWRYPGHYLDVLFVLLMGGAVFIAVGILLYDQLKGILRNKTDVEGWIVAKAEYRERDKPFVYPYDLGRLANIKQVLGQHVFLWWVPGPTQGDGIVWAVVEGCTQWTLTEEQVSQKREKRDMMVPVVAVQRFRGCLACGYGVKTMWHYPNLDDHRMPLDVGDRVMVSRKNTHWYYGEKTHAGGKELPPAERKITHGWFPSVCVVSEASMAERNGNGKMNEGEEKKDK